MNNLHLSHEAENDLVEIRDYIAQDLENPQAAIATVSKITKAIRMFYDHALLGTPLYTFKGRNYNTVPAFGRTAGCLFEPICSELVSSVAENTETGMSTAVEALGEKKMVYLSG